MKIDLADYTAEALNNELIVKGVEIDSSDIIKFHGDVKRVGFGIVLYIGPECTSKVQIGDVIAFSPHSPLHTFDGLMTLPESEATVRLYKKAD